MFLLALFRIALASALVEGSDYVQCRLRNADRPAEVIAIKTNSALPQANSAIPLGKECGSSNQKCASGECLLTNGVKTCRMPLNLGDACSDKTPCQSGGHMCNNGTCKISVSIGQACGQPHQFCAAGECLMTDGGKTCRNPLNLGGACSDKTPCQTGQSCIAGACKISVPVGQACDKPNSVCAAGECLMTDGEKKCRKPLNLGEACSDKIPCQAGHSCISGACKISVPVGQACDKPNSVCAAGECLMTDGAKKCRNPLKLGDTCSDATPCQSDHTCSGGTCKISVSVGQACGQPNQACTTGECLLTNGVKTCRMPSNLGDACSDGTPCQTGHSCIGGACKVSVLAGQPCDKPHSVCATGQCLVTDGVKKCRNPLNLGDPCSDKTPCQDAHQCVNSQCVTPEEALDLTKICLYKELNFKEKHSCAAIDPSLDNSMPAEIKSVRFPAQHKLLVQCQGFLVTATQSVANLNEACGGKQALFWKIVRPAVVKFLNEFVVYTKVDMNLDIGRFESELTQEQAQFAASQTAVAFPWWVHWLSNGIIEMEVRTRIISDHPLRRGYKIGSGYTAFAAEMKEDLPPKGAFDGVFLYFQTEGKLNGAPKDINSGASWTLGGSIAAENQAGFSVMIPWLTTDWQTAWQSNYLFSAFVHEWLHQIEGMADRYGYTEPHPLHEYEKDARYSEHMGSAPINDPGLWQQWYRDYMLNANNVRGIPLHVWQKGNIRGLLN